MVQRQCASLMGTSFPQALAMVRWSYCGAAAAELRAGDWGRYLCLPLPLTLPGILPGSLLPRAGPASRPQDAERYGTASRPSSQLRCDGGRGGVPGLPYMAREPERPLLDGVAQERAPSSQGTRPAFWGGLAGVTSPAQVPPNPCSDATWLCKGWGQSGAGSRGARPPVCVCARFSTCPPHPRARQRGAGGAAHLLGQSAVLGPLADVAAQVSHHRLVLERLLLHGLDLQRPALLCGRREGWSS